jgi:hypothetical protein
MKDNLIDLLIMLATAAMLTVVVNIPVHACEGSPCGDADGSCDVTVNDARLILRSAIGLNGKVLGRDDTTGNGQVNVIDALYTLRNVVGIVSDPERCPLEMTVRTAAETEPWHTLTFDILIDRPWAQGGPDWPPQDEWESFACRSLLEADVVFEYGVAGHEEAGAPWKTSYGLVVPTLAPFALPDGTDLIQCLIYPSEGQGWQTTAEAINISAAEFSDALDYPLWLDEFPLKVLVLPANWPGWMGL